MFKIKDIEFTTIVEKTDTGYLAKLKGHDHVIFECQVNVDLAPSQVEHDIEARFKELLKYPSIWYDYDEDEIKYIIEEAGEPYKKNIKVDNDNFWKLKDYTCNSALRPVPESCEFEIEFRWKYSSIFDTDNQKIAFEKEKDNLRIELNGLFNDAFKTTLTNKQTASVKLGLCDENSMMFNDWRINDNDNDSGISVLSFIGCAHVKIAGWSQDEVQNYWENNADWCDFLSNVGDNYTDYCLLKFPNGTFAGIKFGMSSFLEETTESCFVTALKSLPEKIRPEDWWCDIEISSVPYEMYTNWN